MREPPATSELVTSGPSGVVLSLRGLEVDFASPNGVVHAVRGVDLDLRRGRAVALVGESGCGKSVTARALMGLVPNHGTTRLDALTLWGSEGPQDMSTADARAWRRVRGREIAMVFQEPGRSLSPVHSVGQHLAEVLRLRGVRSARQIRDESARLLADVGIPAPLARLRSYPFELSGGMQQRVLIALALAGSPRILIADEPTTALDVTTQAQILDLIARLQVEHDLALLWITHDLGVVAEIADEVVVMYGGRVIEEASVDAFFDAPQHPYARALLDALPQRGEPGRDLESIPGSVVSPFEVPAGCSFAPRCRRAFDRCRAASPQLGTSTSGRAACFLLETGAVDGPVARDHPTAQGAAR